MVNRVLIHRISVDSLFRVLEDSESRREHRCRSKAQNPSGLRTDTGYVSSGLRSRSRSGD